MVWIGIGLKAGTNISNFVSIEKISESPEETLDWAAEFAARLQPGAVLALIGDLGAGKTCFVQGLAEGLKVSGPVNSPTYTLVNEYEGRLPLYHMDVYRLNDPEEALDFGLNEYLYGRGVTVIEWADRLGDVLPATAWHLYFENGDSEFQRRIRIQEAGK